MTEGAGSKPADTGDPTAIVRLDDEEAVHALLVDTLFRLSGIVNNLTRLRPSRRERFRVTIFGSARTRPGDWVYEQVREMCACIAALGCDIVTGGGPDLMEAANRGAKDGQTAAGGSRIGIRVHLPFEQSANPFVDQNFEHSTFFTRLHQFVLMSDAYVVAPGGIGTLLEAAMVGNCFKSAKSMRRWCLPGRCGKASSNGQTPRCCVPASSWRASATCSFPNASTTLHKRWAAIAEHQRA
jgi:hypothetical protein